MQVARLYTGSDGESHFEEIDLPYEKIREAENTAMQAATGIQFRRNPPGHFSDFHIAPGGNTLSPWKARWRSVSATVQFVSSARRCNVGRRPDRTGPHHGSPRGPDQGLDSYSPGRLSQRLSQSGRPSMPTVQLDPTLEMYFEDDDYTDPWAPLRPSSCTTATRKLTPLVCLGPPAGPPLPGDTPGRQRVRAFQRTPEGYDWSLSNFATDLQALLDYLGVDKAHLIGETVGGTISLKFAHEHPER